MSTPVDTPAGVPADGPVDTAISSPPGTPGGDPPIGATVGAMVNGGRWRRARGWLILLLVAVLVALLVAAFSGGPGRPLDPSSASPDGSRALARVAARLGVTISARTSLPAPPSDAAVVLTRPDDYSDAQLRQLRDTAARLVLVVPGTRAAGVVGAVAKGAAAPGGPGCADAGARAVGALDVPADAIRYAGRPGAGYVSCFDGVLVIGARVTVIGSAALLTNELLGAPGVAALDVNAISADRSLRGVDWVLSGPDAAGPGPTSVWALFPDGARRVFWWLAVVGVLLVLWRARRLGAVVREPLPVIVPAAEIVTGRGRLWRRADAHDRAATSLRDGTVARLRERLALPDAPPVTLAAVLERAGGPPAVVTVDLLAGGAPIDDTALQSLARALSDLERRAMMPAGDRRGHSDEDRERQA